MKDLTCTECERLWEAYDSAALAALIVEHKSGTETGLAAIVRKASYRCQEARKAVEDHAQLIARRVRECQVHSEIVPASMPAAQMLARKPKAVGRKACLNSTP